MKRKTNFETNPFHLALILGGVSLILIGQFWGEWPFSQISVYRNPLPDGLRIHRHCVAVTSEGQLDVVRLENVDFEIVRLHSRAHQHARNESDRQRSLKALADYVVRVTPPFFHFHGLKMYLVTWDIDAGRIIDERVVDEFKVFGGSKD
ncbi:MAG: hypothetical protein P8N76_26500 [Pirellulaceae bacterium]|nr:hypothetical protein [Pirellulaceae bacterium]